MPTINDSVQFLKGVGPAFAKKFEKLGILTIRDLLLCYPRKYIDYTQPYTVVSAPYDVECCVRATVLQKEPARRVKGGRVMNRVLAADDSGILALSWFNAPYAADKLEVGETYYFEGRIGGALTRRELLHPLVRTEAQVADCPFVAVYPGTDGLPASRHASCAHAALAFADQLVDPLPPELLTRYRMPAKAQAVRGIHAPKNADDLAAARRRLIFEELPRAAQDQRPHAPAGPRPVLAQPAVPAHRCAKALHRGNSGRSLRRCADEPAFAGRCRQRQNAGGRSGHLVCRAERLAERHAGSHGNFSPPARRHAGGPARAVRRQRHAAGRRHESEGEAHRAGGYRRWAGKFSRRYACRADRHRGI